MPKRKSNNPSGRPITGIEPKKPYKAMLEPWEHEFLRSYGEGNFSRGVSKARALAEKAR